MAGQRSCTTPFGHGGMAPLSDERSGWLRDLEVDGWVPNGRLVRWFRSDSTAAGPSRRELLSTWSCRAWRANGQVAVEPTTSPEFERLLARSTDRERPRGRLDQLSTRAARQVIGRSRVHGDHVDRPRLEAAKCSTSRTDDARSTRLPRGSTRSTPRSGHAAISRRARGRRCPREGARADREGPRLEAVVIDGLGAIRRWAARGRGGRRRRRAAWVVEAGRLWDRKTERHARVRVARARPRRTLNAKATRSSSIDEDQPRDTRRSRWSPA